MKINVFKLIYVLVFLNCFSKVVDSTSNQLGLSSSLLKIITQDGSEQRTNDRTQYVIEDLGPSLYFSFRTGAVCKEVKYQDYVLWTLDGSDSKPRAICMHMDSNQIVFQFSGNLVTYQLTNNQWESETKNLNELFENLPNESVEIITEDGEPANKMIKGKVSVDYNLDGTKCTSVSYNGNPLWTPGSETDNQYPRRVNYNFIKKVALIQFSHFYLLFSCGSDRCNLLSKTKICEPSSGITIITNDQAGSTQEGDMSSYLVREYDLVSEYVFNNEYNCTEFKFGSQTLWKYSDDTSIGYPRTLCFHQDLRLLFAEFDERIYSYKCTEQECMIITKYPLDGFTNSRLTFVTENDMHQAGFNDPGQFNEKSFGFGSEFTFKSNVKCTQVMYDNKPVWTYGSYDSGDKHPAKVFFNSFTKMIIVDFIQFYMIYQYDGSVFYLISTDTLYGSTQNDFSFIGENNVVLDKNDYEAIKYPFGYAAAVQFKSAKCSEIKFNDNTVWAQNPQIGQINPAVLYVNWDMKMLIVESPQFFNAYMYINNEWKNIFTFPDASQDRADIPSQDIADIPSQAPVGKPQEEKASKLRGADDSKPVKFNKTVAIFLVVIVIVGILFIALAIKCFMK
ncbi:hypothetical protein TpMuguga_04g00020 [Theileria parva strain Muguga]|uniref:Transmembrane protein n=1 Tax=Theileria parva TaxID=5875 RepID=Q4N3G3_THEPA|nr:uncharacterized protein TpMuguga_04g00020 [Theileria parva strain Muguga]EAN31372.1 hypothetical protein TpMuguga_04g00020 [Theileria parva strain Muguga]|eukprot:XP_763655.1 hypothetical protein [Theileria parva strain Muguga]